jgi:hypothetical protein
MDENQEQGLEEKTVQGVEAIDLETLIALVEERVIENLTRAIERIVQERD